MVVPAIVSELGIHREFAKPSAVSPRTRAFDRGEVSWEITWIENAAEVAWGRLGKIERTTEHHFLTQEACARFIESQIADILRSGYEERDGRKRRATKRVNVDAHFGAEAKPLLEACLAEPDDDAPRLVYADWLLERGDPLGELIIVQCTLARDGGDREALVQRERELLSKHRARWEGELSVALYAARLGAPAWAWVRGFIDNIIVSAEAWEKSHSTVRRLAPLPGRLRCELMAPEYADAFFGSAYLAPLSSLTITGDPKTKGWEAFARATQLRHLRELRIECELLSAAEIRLLLGGPSAARVRALELGALTNASAASDILRALGDVARASELHTLGLAKNKLGTKGLTALTSLSLPALRKLDLSTASLAPSVLQLANAPWLRKLERLDLSDNKLGGRGLQSLVRVLPADAALTHLVLDRCQISGGDLRILAEAPSLARLTVLSLNHNAIDPAGLEVIARAMPSLTVVKLAKNNGWVAAALRPAVRDTRVVLEL